MEINDRKQGHETLLPRVRCRSRFSPLSSRYLFAGHSDAHTATAMQHTFGIMYIVTFGVAPARVPLEVIDEIRARMDDHGVIAMVRSTPEDALFAARQHERLSALEQGAAAGFRLRPADQGAGGFDDGGLPGQRRATDFISHERAARLRETEQPWPTLRR